MTATMQCETCGRSLDGVATDECPGCGSRTLFAAERRADFDVAYITPGDRAWVVTKPLDTTPISYDVNPGGWLGGYDAVICDTPDRTMLREVLLNKARRPPLLFRMRGDPFWGIHHWIGDGLKQRVALKMLGAVDGCVAIAPHQADTYREETGVETAIAQVSKDPDDWPDTTHTDDEVRALTLTNAMYPNKLAPTIAAVPLVDEWLADNAGRWHICGDGKYSHQLREATADADNVHYLGWEDGAEMLDWANLLLHLSDFDSFANAILEGMASELPVVASDHPAFTTPDLPIDIADGPEDIRRYLRRYLHPGERTAAGRANVAAVEDRFTHADVGEQWVEALQHFVKP